MSYLSKQAIYPKIAIINLSPSSATWTTANTPTFTPTLKSGTSALPYSSISGNDLILDAGCYYVEFWIGGSKSVQSLSGSYSPFLNGTATADFIGSTNPSSLKNRCEGSMLSFTISDNQANLSFACTTVSSGTFTFVTEQCFAILYKV